MKLVNKNDAILKEQMPPFNFEDPIVDPMKLVEDMAEIMMEKNGLGLAANQVGVRTRMFIIGNPSDKDSIMAFFNPVIVSHGIANEVMLEGCLSYPNFYVKIKRPTEIRIRYTDVGGNTDTMKLTGMTARVAQHEMEHLDGKIFYRAAHPMHLEQAKKQMKKLKRSIDTKTT